MTDTSGSMGEPLLVPVSGGQRALLEIVGAAVAETGGWPVHQYVEAKMDERGFDISAVFGSMPFMSDGGMLRYSLARRDMSGRDEEPVKLTVAGLAHLEQFTSTVEMFLRVLAELGERRAAASYDPRRVVTVEISGPQLVKDLQIEDEPFVALLPDLLRGEPATWHGAGNVDADGWVHRPSGVLRRFRDVRTVEDYLARLRAWIVSPAPVSPPVLSSPLSLAAAFDYLDVVWRLRFVAQLVHVPSTERAARLAFDASTAEEFDNRLSALGEMLKGLEVPGSGKHGSLKRLSAFLGENLSAEAMARVNHAIATLQAATHVRNGGQHIGASSEAAMALPSFGLTFPIVDHTAAWRTVQAHVIEALDTLREEIQATI